MNKINLKGVDFHFGIGFLNELLDGTGLRLDELGSQDEVNIVPKMMYYSNKYATKRNGESKELYLTDFYDLIDENGGIGGPFWTDFQNAFQTAMTQNVPVDTKKKASRKK